MSLMQTQSSHHPLWPEAVIVLGLSLTLSWMLLLAAGLLRLLQYVI
jgi:hypothetical protein